MITKLKKVPEGVLIIFSDGDEVMVADAQAAAIELGIDEKFITENLTDETLELIEEDVRQEPDTKTHRG